MHGSFDFLLRLSNLKVLDLYDESDVPPQQVGPVIPSDLSVMYLVNTCPCLYASRVVRLMLIKVY